MREAEEDAAQSSRLLFLARSAAHLTPGLRRPVPLVFALVASGCGGGLPLLHPARTLPPGELRLSAGFSGNVAVGALADAANQARQAAAVDPAAGAPAAGGAASEASHAAAVKAYAEGAMVAASVGPGLSPLVGGRVGLASAPDGGGYEGGLAYTGRAARADIRRSFELMPRWAMSVGAGGSAILNGRQEGSALADVDLGRMHGWGVDVPVVIGYESDGDLYIVWVGARGGGEHVDLRGGTGAPGSAGTTTAPSSLSATRFWGGGLLGLAIGFRHLHVAMELDVSYATVTGDYNSVHAQIRGLTVAPASALWWRF